MRWLLAAPALLAACGGDGITPPPLCELEAVLATGQVLATDPPSSEPGCGLLIPSGAPGSRYRVALLWPDSAAASATASVTLHVEGLGVTGTAAAPEAGPAPVAGPSSEVLSGLRASLATSRLHQALRRSEAEMVERLGTGALLPDRSARPLAAPGAPSPPKVHLDPGTSCSAPRSTRTGSLLGENDVMAIYQDTTEVGSLRVRADHVERLLDYFESYGKSTVESYFGGLPDVDGNGKVIVFLSGHPQPFDQPTVVAYVWAGNYYEPSVCPASDKAEVIFMNPARVRSMDNREYVSLGVLSHESQHLVSLYHRLRRTERRNSSVFLSHPTWIEEGRAEVADEVTSRVALNAVAGVSRTAPLDSADMRAFGTDALGRCCRPEAYGVALETARTIWYLAEQPNGLAVVPNGADTDADIRNGGWHFHRWLGDGLGGAGTSAGGDANMFRSLTDSLTASGEEGLQAVLGSSFEDLLDDFSTGIMLHGMGAPGSAPGFTTYDFLSLTAMRLFSTVEVPEGPYPWPVTRSAGGAVVTKSFQTATYSGLIGPTGIRIHDFTSNGTGTGARLTVTSPVPVRLVVVRLR